MSARRHRGLVGVAILVGSYAITSLVTGFLFDFGIATALCAALVIGAHFWAAMAERDRKLLAQQREAVWERRGAEDAAKPPVPFWRVDHDELRSVWPASSGAPE
jgi:hypothetical protein